ncbi:unnamed protein product [Boreogadus saida]
MEAADGGCGWRLWVEAVGGGCGWRLWVEAVGGGCRLRLWVEAVGGGCGLRLWMEAVDGGCGWRLWMGPPVPWLNIYGGLAAAVAADGLSGKCGSPSRRERRSKRDDIWPSAGVPDRFIRLVQKPWQEARQLPARDTCSAGAVQALQRGIAGLRAADVASGIQGRV